MEKQTDQVWIEPEFVDNPENRCPVVLLLDTSASMRGDRITALNGALQHFKSSIIQDECASLRVEIAIVTFGKSVSVVQHFVGIDEFNPPQLAASGLTPMGSAMALGIDLIAERKAIYKRNGVQYYRPWLLLITDGGPNDDWVESAHRMQQADTDKKLISFVIGVQEADMHTLKRIAPPQRPPVHLRGLEFAELFSWLSTSLQRVSSGKVGEMRALPPITGWAEVEA